MNNKEKRLNKNKIIIIVCILILLIVIITGVLVLIYKINKKSDNNAENESSTASIETKVIDKFYNNFLIAYILQADVKTGEGTLTINGDPYPYYAVTDPILENIHSIDDISNLIEDTLRTESVIRVNKLLKSEYANQYINTDNTLYVRKTPYVCEVSPFGNIEKDKIQYSNEGNANYAIYDDVPYEIITDKDGKLKTDGMWFGCSQSVNYTHIDKESEYDPNKEPDNMLIDDEIVENGEK